MATPIAMVSAINKNVRFTRDAVPENPKDTPTIATAKARRIIADDIKGRFTVYTRHE